ncbi:uncharacterized protein LOC111632235 [Centruroides sculpturatus]|uniref:uncharacterized protein LOC111632235 n=1 Tax=Centruroides sculpturatus TaxID=218467 RepID=UPI000C6E1BE6|nr:uncharacterized protein LOC111632235 [Centruroides sculpturatus]XP_023232386.1 uncharacterized protein LOC111632235 [Centruroides sculpturatus]XP_023232387.1 uncharacterized protein LOC111632235 [Centruroides sculpturatus]XP_023232388.1 uncharacterized protein LOC111632235 [Centruroides sculpturatus]XP_023232389.1 uncharacterized protein LOC111632235 [Centruroides sculpturatus]
MAQVKKGSYPSRQLRAGPAPLASFEDLPSDELESPDSLADLDENILNSQSSRPTDFDGSSTPRTLTASALSTPQFDSDGDSQFTITPCDGVKSHVPGLKTSSLSSLLKTGKEDDRASLSSTGGKKGSVSSLLSAGESSRPTREDSHRKGSWTDIFRSRSRSRSRSPQGSPQRLRKKSDSSMKYKSDTESNDKNDSKKEKGKFLSSLFKIGGKKSPKSKSPSPPKSPADFQPVPITEKIEKNRSAPSKQVESKLDSQTISETKETLNKTVTSKEESNKNITQNQLVNNKIIKKEEKRVRPTDIELESIHGLPSTTSRHKVEDHDNISHAEIESDTNKKESIPHHDSEGEHDHESSESELTFEVDKSKTTLETRDSEEDYEAQNLLNQDSMDTDEFPVAEFRFLPPEASQIQIKTPTRKQRLEVTTIPIERPRSTTPINIAPLEAFIQSATPSPDPGIEKIRLSLPGEQFILRPKSPKKGNLKSWQDFCEEGLHSPRLNKRPQNEDEFVLPLKSPTDDEYNLGTESPNKIPNSNSIEDSWVTFENITDDNTKNPNNLDISKKNANCKNVLDDKGESFQDNFQSEDFNKESVFTDCSCICHKCNCECHNVNVDMNSKHLHDSDSSISGATEIPKEQTEQSILDSQTDIFAKKIPKSFDINKCNCKCHKKCESDLTFLCDDCLSQNRNNKCVSSDKQNFSVEDKEQ